MELKWQQLGKIQTIGAATLLFVYTRVGAMPQLANPGYAHFTTVLTSQCDKKIAFCGCTHDY